MHNTKQSKKLSNITNKGGHTMKSILFSVIYRMIEAIDGEHGIKLLPYSIAERIKVVCLHNIY